MNCFCHSQDWKDYVTRIFLPDSLTIIKATIYVLLNYYEMSSNSVRQLFMDFLFMQGIHFVLERIWLRYYATSRKVAGSIPDEIIGIFN
jgi:hypothetical protein